MSSLLVELIEKLDMGIVITDNEMNIVHWNQWMFQKTQISRGISIGESLLKYAPKLQEYYYSEILEDVIKTGNSRFLSGALHKIFFKSTLEQTSESLIQNIQISRLVENKNTFLLIQVNDISSQNHKVQKLKNFIQDLEIENVEMKKNEENNKKMARHDSLTSLPNRIYIMEELERLIEISRNSSEQLAVCFIDIDYLKNINDDYGHQFGDSVLKEFALRLKESVRSTDFVGRISGDEFIVIIPNIKSRIEIQKIAENILKSYENPFEIRGISLKITCSIGVAIYPKSGKSSIMLLEEADRKLYEVKKAGRFSYKIPDFID